jgi:hypothetical protein
VNRRLLVALALVLALAMPARADTDITLYRGEVRTLSLTLGVDITGYSLRFSVVSTLDSATKWVTKTTGGGGITVVDAATGHITIAMDSADTQSVPAGGYFYDLWRSDASDRPLTVGKFRLLPTARYPLGVTIPPAQTLDARTVAPTTARRRMMTCSWATGRPGCSPRCRRARTRSAAI